jgi:hypothetical protein
MTGHLIATSEVRETGPATFVNGLLSYGGPSVVQTNLMLEAYATYDLAVFGEGTAPVSVRVQGSGVGGSQNGSSLGYITIYETDAGGNFSTIVNFWEFSSSFSTTVVDELVQLQSNELYKVIVRSIVSVNLNTVSSFDGYAYRDVDPRFTSETAGFTAAVSPNMVPEPGAGLAGASAFAVLVLLRRSKSGFGA